jgi:hypothetical protein
MNGGAPLRRLVAPGRDGRWAVELTPPDLHRAGVAPGARLRVALTEAPETPSVLLAAIEAAGLSERWAALPSARRRDLAEKVFAARGAQTREMWVAQALATLGGRW